MAVKSGRSALCRRRLIVVLAGFAVAALSGPVEAGASSSPDAGVPQDAGGPAHDAHNAGVSPTTPELRITGASVLPESVARTAIGFLPGPGEDVHAWGDWATERIMDAYRARGYTFARVWFSDSKQPGVLWFDIDEGRVRVAFVGIGSIGATLFRLRLNLPGGVFQKDDFERSLAEQKKALHLVNVSYRVHELQGSDVTAFGEVVPARTLEIHVERHESFGRALDISVSASWGVVPSLKYSAADLIWDDDRLLMQVDLAFPYRRYIFDAAPRFTWVHGGVSASYRMPHFGLRTVEFLGFAPRVDMSAYLSQYARSDLKLTSFYLLRNQAVANLVSSWSNTELSLGLGADLARAFFVQTVAVQPGTQPAGAPADVYSARGMARASARWTPAVSWSRRDRRIFATLTFDLCFPVEVRATLWGQYVVLSGRHRFFLRGRAVGLAGSVPFWDDVELAGEYQRVFFNDVYWAHQALQFETAYRIKLWRDWFEAGFFHDVTLFEDRLSSPAMLRLMDAFGPSLHFLILDQYALSIHQGIGFAPGRFSQTLSFTVETAF